ncbi:MAG: hypothetical protein J6A04_03700 [Clostridia bacterium]|nr:hypothetical protein [Clostridia bacterium]
MIKERESNIELLRIISILGVIVLHYNNPQIGGGFKFVIPNSINYWILMTLESIFICAVNVFIIISGYFLIEKKSRNLWKVIELILQVVLIELAFYIFKDCIIERSFSIKGLINSLIPTNYFVILYSTLFIISPYINKIVSQINLKEYKKFLIILFIIFSIYPTIIDLASEIFDRDFFGLSTIGAYGSQFGYTIVNFILMYLIGGYIYKSKCFAERKKLIRYFVLNLIIIIGWSCINTITAWEYSNPFVIIEAILIFMIFRSMNLKSKIINKLAKGCFFTFLLHGKLLNFIKIELFAKKHFLIMSIHIVISTVLIYMICYVIFIIYAKCSTPIINYLKKKVKLPEIKVD